MKKPQSPICRISKKKRLRQIITSEQMTPDMATSLTQSMPLAKQFRIPLIAVLANIIKIKSDSH